jgi:hypothetical protein
MDKRKKRTRTHIIASLSVNNLEYHVIKKGYTLDVPAEDYGYDALIFTFNKKGEIDTGAIFVQIKAKEKLKLKKNSFYSYPLKKKDLDLWYDEPYPVYLVLYDAQNEKAYWTEMKENLKARNIIPAKIKNDSLTVYIDPNNILLPETPKQWRDHKQSITKRILAGLYK